MSPQDAYRWYTFKRIHAIIREAANGPNETAVIVVFDGLNDGLSKGWLRYMVEEAKLSNVTLLEVPYKKEYARSLNTGLRRTDAVHVIGEIRRLVLDEGYRLVPFCTRTGDGFQEVLNRIFPDLDEDKQWTFVAADHPSRIDDLNNKARFHRLVVRLQMGHLLVRPFEIKSGYDAVHDAYLAIAGEHGHAVCKLCDGASGDGTYIGDADAPITDWLSERAEHLDEVLIQRAWLRRAEMSVGWRGSKSWISRQLVSRGGNYQGSVCAGSGIPLPGITPADVAWLHSDVGALRSRLQADGHIVSGPILFDVLRNLDTGERGIIEACARTPGSEEIYNILMRAMLSAGCSLMVGSIFACAMSDGLLDWEEEIRPAFERAGLLYRAGQKCGVLPTMVQGLKSKARYARIVAIGRHWEEVRALLIKAAKILSWRILEEVLPAA